MAMKNPGHPGAIVREDRLKPQGLTVTEGVKRLSAGRQAMSNLVHERRRFRSRWTTAAGSLTGPGD